MALVRALNKMTKAGMPESVYCLKTQPAGETYPKSDLFNKAHNGRNTPV
jgi:hypothetical protein